MSRRKKRIINKIKVTLNSPKENKSSKWEKVKGWIVVIASIIAILTFCFFIYDRYHKEDKVETLKKEILSTIEDIEKDLNSNAITNSPDSSLIREYQQAVASICAQWRSLEGNNLFSDLKSRSVEEKKTIAYDYLSRWRTHQLTKIVVLYSLIKLNTESNRLGMDYSKVLSMQEQENKSHKARGKYFDTIKQHLLSYNADGVIEELDKIRNDIECLKFDKEYFEYVKEANKLVNSTLLSQ